MLRHSPGANPPQNTWSFLTRREVTWREASEGSFVLVTVAAVLGAAAMATWANRHSWKRSS